MTATEISLIIPGAPKGKTTAPCGTTHGDGLCQCGCGAQTPIATKTNVSRGHVKGVPLRFVSGHNTRGTKRVESDQQRNARFWAKVDRLTVDECWQWMAGRFGGGYGQFKSNGQTYVASRLAWEIANGRPPEAAMVCHRCDNPPCCNPTHLFLGSAADNNDDMHSKGRAVVPRRGEGSGRKLTAKQVAAIRAAYAAGDLTQRQIAAQYDVGQMTVSRVVRRETW